MEGLVPHIGLLLSKRHWLTDSRRLVNPADTVFFALKGSKTDGHRFVAGLYSLGVRLFVVHQTFQAAQFPEAHFISVPDTLSALQHVAATKREQLQCPLLAITGSNGKTIVKEWLHQLLQPDLPVGKSPKSYNSQVGVPLSIAELAPYHRMAILEAGISRPSEMLKLQAILKPTWGLFTNLGPAHDEGFSSRRQKLQEKLQLFKGVERLFFCADHTMIAKAIRHMGVSTFTWSANMEQADVQLKFHALGNGQTQIRVQHGKKVMEMVLPFSDSASLENAAHCLSFLLWQGTDPLVLQKRFGQLSNIPLRLETKKGRNGCPLVIDAYNNDLAGLGVALDFMEQQAAGMPKTVILSELLESGLEQGQLYRKVADLLMRKGVGKVLAVGGGIAALKEHTQNIRVSWYPTTEGLLKELQGQKLIGKELVLLKGARKYAFEKVAAVLQEKVHGTRLEVNLDALAQNFAYFKSLLRPTTKVMVMVKAFAYGSGSMEVARLLQYQHADYLAVAYPDEGIYLREQGIRLPIMVMNPAPETFPQLVRYGLQPEIYSLSHLHAWTDFTSQQRGAMPHVHLALDTGMKRLGFEPAQLAALFQLLGKAANVRVDSIFSHLVSADDPAESSFTRSQIATFTSMCERICRFLGYRPLRHILNTAGIMHFAEAQMDMVRLGIGLYGITSAAPHRQFLRNVATLKTTVSQVKKLVQGDTIGYGRAGKAERPTQIATLAIGYADGFDRGFSLGVGKVLINGSLAPVIGRVCMDMTMVDVTGLQVAEGDEAVIFGEYPTARQLADWIDTIPYEIISRLSERVKRVFYD